MTLNLCSMLGTYLLLIYEHPFIIYFLNKSFNWAIHSPMTWFCCTWNGVQYVRLLHALSSNSHPGLCVILF